LTEESVVELTSSKRLLLGQNSYLAAFTDYAYLENITNRTRAFLRPWGIGGGINFETKAGIFGISIAARRSAKGIKIASSGGPGRPRGFPRPIVRVRASPTHDGPAKLP